jgi:hypothetical protein
MPRVHGKTPQGTDTLYTSEQLVFADAPDVLFVTTYFDDVVQFLDPSADVEWLDHNTTTTYIPSHDLLNTLNVQVVSRIKCQSNHFARYSELRGAGIEYVFSNYQSSHPDRARNWSMTLKALLDDAYNMDPCGIAKDFREAAVGNSTNVSVCCAATGADACPWAGHLYGRGMDISVEYKWNCPLQIYSDPDSDRARRSR